MKFTIVTPSFNQGLYIERTILSVLKQPQTGFELEYFVIDNCSTDQTKEVLARYETADEPIKILIRPDKGQYDAINRGWLEGSGDILAWLNSDDIYCENALEQVASFFQRHPEVMAIYGEAIYIDRHDRLLKPVTNIREYSRLGLRSHDFITQPATFIRRQVFEQVGLLSGDYRYVFDWEYWIRISNNYEFVRVPFLIAGYRITGDNLTTTGKTQRLREMLHLVWKSGGIVHLLRFLLRLIKKYLFKEHEIPNPNLNDLF